jgi:succinate dehydrogenase / fumarate reductase cytochrome b subunit
MRPRYLDLFRIRLPLPGFVSILHRVSGLLLFLAIPIMLYSLEASLSSNREFDALRQMFDSIPAKLIDMLMIWAMLHHLFAGIRFLLLDLGIGVSLGSARAASRWVMAASLLLTLYSGFKLW